MKIQMMQNEPLLDQESLAKNRAHYGNEPHYFWVSFDETHDAQLVDVGQVWQAAREGERPTYFRYAPLMASDRQMLQFITSLEEGLNR